MKMGKDQTPPLQCTSDEEDWQWMVHIKPILVSFRDWEQQIESQNRVFKALQPGFDWLKEKPVSLNA